jgi:hypothetical protein
MEPWSSWLGLTSGVLILVGYEIYLGVRARRDPAATARSAHRALRGEWVRALSRQPGSELLAVQTLRNSLMSATITASTAALSTMGAISLMSTKAAPGSSWFDLGSWSSRRALEVLVLVALSAAYVCSAMAARYYHHSSFLMSLPVGSAERTRRETTATGHVQRAGVLYSWSLRCFLFLAPILVGLATPLWMPPAALVLVALLHLFDAAPDRPSA